MKGAGKNQKFLKIVVDKTVPGLYSCINIKSVEQEE